MRWRVLALVSLGVNLILALGWVLMARHNALVELTSRAPSVLSPTNTPNPKVVIRRQFFSWREVESADYATYIANLRDIGCPEQTIRDIIIADINGLFSRRMATELITANQQWWRSEPDPEIAQAAAEKTRALDEERRTLLTRLLGPSWESGDMANLPRPSRPGVVLDGPVLGPLPTDIKQAIQDLNVHSEDRLQAYLERQRSQGKEPDPVELGKIRQQTRNELARILSPQQLEEFLLRYSQTANNLRSEAGQLRYFNPTPDEFRALFRAADPVDQQLSLLGDGTDPNTRQIRKSLEDQRENAIRIALGPRRYEEYRLLHDPLYRDAVATAQETGTPEAARVIYQINLASSEEQNRILTDTNLTTDQKNIELKQLELDQLRASTLAKGQDLPPEPPTAPTPPARRTYTLRPGDTAAVVAMIYGLPVSALRAANPNVDLGRLKPGDSLTIPGVNSPPLPPQ